MYREINRNSLGARAIAIGRGNSTNIGWENSLDDDTRISRPMSRESQWRRLPPVGFSRLRKNPGPWVILSEAKNLSSIQMQSAERFFGEKRASE
jgi:hypothetical protein